MSNNVFLVRMEDNKYPDGFNRIKVTFTNENEVVTSRILFMSSIAGDRTGITSLSDFYKNKSRKYDI